MTFSFKSILQPQRPSGIQVIKKKKQIHKLQFTLCNICVSDKETFSTLGLHIKFLTSNKFLSRTYNTAYTVIPAGYALEKPHRAWSEPQPARSCLNLRGDLNYFHKYKPRV